MVFNWTVFELSYKVKGIEKLWTLDKDKFNISDSPTPCLVLVLACVCFGGDGF